MARDPGVGGAGGRQLSVYTAVTTGAVGGVGRVSGISWLHGATRRGDLPQQCSGPHDLGSESLYPSAQRRVGGVDQGRRPVWECVHELHDSIIRSIPAAMSGVDHGKALGRQWHGGWLLPIVHNRPYTTVAERQRNDLGDETSRCLGSAAPPTVWARAHDVVAVAEYSVLRRLGHAVCGLRHVAEASRKRRAGGCRVRER